MSDYFHESMVAKMVSNNDYQQGYAVGFNIGYQQGRAESIDKICNYVKRECNPYGKPTIDFESGKKILNYLNQTDWRKGNE